MLNYLIIRELRESNIDFIGSLESLHLVVFLKMLLNSSWLLMVTKNILWEIERVYIFIVGFSNSSLVMCYWSVFRENFYIILFSSLVNVFDLYV